VCQQLGLDGQHAEMARLKLGDRALSHQVRCPDILLIIFIIIIIIMIIIIIKRRCACHAHDTMTREQALVKTWSRSGRSRAAGTGC
jgi:uncharacterized membrane protein YqiK